MEILSIEIRNIFFTCKNCENKKGFIKYDLKNQIACNNCIENIKLIKKKTSYTPSIVGDYTKFSSKSIESGLEYFKKQIKRI